MIKHLLIFGAVCTASWFIFIWFWPRMMLYVYKTAILVRGFGDGPIPVNTLYTEPVALFADPLHATVSGPKLATTGVNRDTLLTIGWLDLKNGPLVLHVPDMAARYYSVQFTDPTKNSNFAYVGKRTTGTKAGAYIIVGPRQKETIPPGVAHIFSPSNSVLIIGRVLVEGDDDLPMAHALTKQIQIVPLSS